MTAPIPVGSRVVLVEDHRVTPEWGEKGWRGEVLEAYEAQSSEYGAYYIRFDNYQVWWLNASAVAIESEAPLTPWERDTALAMALTLADLLANESPITSAAFALLQRIDGRPPCRVSDWLRDCVRRDLERE